MQTRTLTQTDISTDGTDPDAETDVLPAVPPQSRLAHHPETEPEPEPGTEAEAPAEPTEPSAEALEAVEAVPAEAEEAPEPVETRPARAETGGPSSEPARTAGLLPPEDRSGR